MNISHDLIRINEPVSIVILLLFQLSPFHLKLRMTSFGNIQIPLIHHGVLFVERLRVVKGLATQGIMTWLLDDLKSGLSKLPTVVTVRELYLQLSRSGILSKIDLFDKT